MLNSHTNLAALRCTPSKAVLSQLVKGDQVTDAYSTIGLTMQNRLTFTETEHSSKFLCRNPWTECACSSLSYYILIVTPRYFQELSLLMVYSLQCDNQIKQVYVYLLWSNAHILIK